MFQHIGLRHVGHKAQNGGILAGLVVHGQILRAVVPGLHDAVQGLKDGTALFLGGEGVQGLSVQGVVQHEDAVLSVGLRPVAQGQHVIIQGDLYLPLPHVLPVQLAADEVPILEGGAAFDFRDGQRHRGPPGVDAQHAAETVPPVPHVPRAADHRAAVAADGADRQHALMFRGRG